ncbi:MAG: SpoIVB peptidase S55 domain-containing protein [Polyangiales bacterium]
MRPSTLALLTVSGALAASGALLAQSRPNAPPQIMPVSEVRAGMRGYGLTVFRGTRPERFDVEVIDVVHNFRPHMDAILIRPNHPITDHAGTVAGMSGSPIYIDGRLIGAYAYGWEFGRDPVAGVTPIESMLAELHRPRRTPPGLLPGSQIPSRFCRGAAVVTAPTTRPSTRGARSRAAR